MVFYIMFAPLNGVLYIVAVHGATRRMLLTQMMALLEPSAGPFPAGCPRTHLFAGPTAGVRVLSAATVRARAGLEG